MTQELSTLDKSRPTTLQEKRRIERELGLEVEPPIVMPKSNRPGPDATVWQRFKRWVRGAPE